LFPFSPTQALLAAAILAQAMLAAAILAPISTVLVR
jgi:hypothetical protein